MLLKRIAAFGAATFWAIFLAWLTAVLLSLAGRDIGAHFIASPQWGQTAFPYAIWFGICVGLLFAVALVLTRAKNPKLKDASPTKVGLYAVLVGGCFFLLSYATVILTIPMAHAKLVSEDVHHTYVIKVVIGHDPRRSRGCYRRTQIDDMPGFIDYLCSRPEGFSQIAKPGDVVLVAGKGSALGVYYDAFNLREQQ
ncbi:hypothetical protein [Nereida sp. MMG025]|uniref:hypothetical protein n=1 Tax=Nereida sp. MMG025 TaxID=2909981 RepID=UPI001F250CE7|nr:hypothetical protein [Nereida sp. MMG025]MCF6445135.1 hypothetical protein [Nereida sp. MMG025]